MHSSRRHRLSPAGRRTHHRTPRTPTRRAQGDHRTRDATIHSSCRRRRDSPTPDRHRQPSTYSRAREHWFVSTPGDRGDDALPTDPSFHASLDVPRTDASPTQQRSSGVQSARSRSRTVRHWDRVPHPVERRVRRRTADRREPFASSLPGLATLGGCDSSVSTAPSAVDQIARNAGGVAHEPGLDRGRALVMDACGVPPSSIYHRVSLKCHTKCTTMSRWQFGTFERTNAPSARSQNSWPTDRRHRMPSAKLS